MNAQIQEIFKDLKKNKGALIGLYTVGLFFVLSLVGPFIAPYSESELTSNLLQDPFWGKKIYWWSLLEQMMSGETLFLDYYLEAAFLFLLELLSLSLVV